MLVNVGMFSFIHPLCTFHTQDYDFIYKHPPTPTYPRSNLRRDYGMERYICPSQVMSMLTSLTLNDNNVIKGLLNYFYAKDEEAFFYFHHNLYCNYLFKKRSKMEMKISNM
jgi:hypothetical protein